MSEHLATKKNHQLKKLARKALFELTDEEYHPNWFNDPQAIKRRDRLLVILGTPIDPVRKVGETKEAFHQRACQYFFDVRPGLEERVISDLLAGKKVKHVSEAYQIPPSKLTYLRKKYHLFPKQPTNTS
ncbi:hypothetical protein [Enterococcus sp. 5B3_DIV0040]|uniref:hypothetical protein n=1 Tax=Enterococcus sp. 5B3_DIV0040 TaxID=1834182 RepID=UPI000A332746|nr:hypothetical protein [Enterococcus sp. 5B3_DIV0040]OTO01224.1 hypothetical protein A5883_003541 [Enterococcus sp. 5B3_DIV0040]